MAHCWLRYRRKFHRPTSNGPLLSCNLQVIVEGADLRLTRHHSETVPTKLSKKNYRFYFTRTCAHTHSIILCSIYVFLYVSLYPTQKKILIKEQSNECFRRWVPISLAIESQSRPQRVGSGPWRPGESSKLPFVMIQSLS